MSSDESDGGTTVKVHQIRRPYWRAQEVGLLLHAIDNVSAHVRVHTIRRGGGRRHRETSKGRVSHRSSPVARLPRNFYTAEILNEVGMSDKLAPKDAVDITLPPEVME